LNKKTIVSLLVLALVAVACATDTGTEEVAEVVAEPTTLETVQARGFLKCGVSGSAVAFSETQADGSVTGIDADYCYAIAAAVFGDYSKVEFTALTAAERFTALSAGEVDVLIRNTTWTQSRDTELGNDFGPTTYYDDTLCARAGDPPMTGTRKCTRVRADWLSAASSLDVAFASQHNSRCASASNGL
jgi:general L-amino acid transport system substrate-binding protein